MKNIRFHWLLAPILIVIVLFSACAAATSPEPSKASSTPAAAKKTLVLGGVSFLTGPASQGGLAYKRGWQLAVDKYNAAGGLKLGNDTYNLELLVEDDAMSVDQAVTVATKLIHKDGAKVLFGGLGPPEKMPLYNLANKAGILFACTDGLNAAANIKYPNNADIAPDKPNYIRTWHALSEVAPIMLDYLKATYPDVKTVALNSVGEDAAIPFGKYINDLLAKRGMSQVGQVEQFPPDMMDQSTLLTRILASKPDAVMNIMGGPPTLGQQTKAARELGFKGPVFTLAKLDSSFQMMLAGPANSYNIFCGGLTLADMGSLPPAVKEVNDAYLKQYPQKELLADLIGAYDGMWVLLQTIEKAGSIDPAKITSTYETLTKQGDLMMTLGPVRVGGKQSYGVNRTICDYLVISSVIDGKPKNVKNVQIDVP